MAGISNNIIKDLFLKTASGYYLNECAKNGGAGSDHEKFFNNQFKEFLAGFKCAEKEIYNAGDPLVILQENLAKKTKWKDVSVWVENGKQTVWINNKIIYHGKVNIKIHNH